MNYGRKDIPCTIVRNRKEGKRPYMDRVHINQDKQLKKKETEEETFQRRMNCIMQIEERGRIDPPNSLQCDAPLLTACYPYSHPC